MVLINCMTIISKSALVSYTPEQMYQLVDDIEAYPAFLPWCGDATILNRDNNTVEASLFIAHSGLNKTFSTRNSNFPYEKIEMRLLDGPFKHLEGVWIFEPLGDAACKVSLNLDFEFSSKIIGLTLGPIFNKIANSLVDAFIQRANSVYA